MPLTAPIRDFPVIALTVAVLLGLALAELFTWLPLLTCLLLVPLAAIGLGQGRTGHILYAAVLLSLVYGQYRHWDIPVDDISHFAGRTVTLTARITSLPEVNDGRVQLLAEALTVDTGAGVIPVSGRLRVNYYPPENVLGIAKKIAPDLAPDLPRSPPLHWGDQFTAQATLRPIPSLHNPGGFDYAAHQWRQGIRVRATLGKKARLVVIRHPIPGIATSLQRWREAMRTAMDAALSPQPAALLAALSIGETGGLGSDLRDRFQAAGVAHMLSISGSHLGLVAGVVFLLVRVLVTRLPHRLLLHLTIHITPRQVAGGAALAVATGYALLSGGSPPTVRSLIMVWMVTLALLSRRDAHGITSLSVAALLILAVDPRALGQASFQLSFIAVLAILLTLPPPPDSDTPRTWRARVLRSARGLGTVTLAAGLATGPLVAWHFGQVNWAGFLSNLVLVPLLGVAVLPFTLAAAVAAPLVGHLPLSGAVDWLLTEFIRAVSAFAALPGAMLPVTPPPAPLLAFTYAAALLAWLGRSHLARPAVLHGALVFLLAWQHALHPSPPTGLLRVAVLDVDQGDAVVVIGPSGDAFLVDGGPRFGAFDTGRMAVAPWLWRQGIHDLTLFSTHPQRDHEGGLPYIVRHFHVPHLYTGGRTESDTAMHRDLLTALEGSGSPITPLFRDDALKPLSGVTASVLNPPPAPPDGVMRKKSDLNGQSLVLRLEYGDHRFLLTGDINAAAERDLLKGGQDLRADVLKIPHHGSASSSTAEFVAAVHPRVAAISVGEGNPFRHPRTEVLERYQAERSVIARTDRDGAVLFESDGQALRTTTWRRLTPEPVAPWATTPRKLEMLNLQRLLNPSGMWQPVPSGE
ncbi:MAG: DNA internalization-related competence protein ComEC/Rec2 [Nitrospirota bacterium]|nr:DNA internalization-related competence protein ComEC/Rec2 [Nitrospirota bacterium]